MWIYVDINKTLICNSFRFSRIIIVITVQIYWTKLNLYRNAIEIIIM